MNLQAFTLVVWPVVLCLGPALASDVPVVSVFEHGPVERGPFEFSNEMCVLRPRQFPTQPQTSLSLCIRFSLFYLPLRGSAVTMVGSWDGPLVFELRDFADYPYSIFRLKWNLLKEPRRLEKGQYWFYWFKPHRPLSLLQWYNLCLSYDSETNDMVAVLDGQLIGRFNNKEFEEEPTVLSEFGIDCVYGSLYGIRAKFADLQLANYALAENQMKNITTCKTSWKGNVFEWNRNNLMEPENGSMVDMPTWELQDFGAFCQGETMLVPFDRYSPDQLGYDQAHQFCNTLGGRMAMPASLEEEGEWAQQFATYSPRYHVERRFFYLPITDKLRDDVWIKDLESTEPDYTNWDIREPNGGAAENCTVLILFNPEVENRTSTWADYPCSTKMGFVCEIEDNIRLELLGLCEDSVIDKEYTGIGFVNERRTFRGKYDFRLEWDAKSEHWTFRSPSSSVFAFHNKSDAYPLGFNEWFVTNDSCWDPGTYRVNLSLSSCFGSNFACRDGSCQALENRCNQKKDCLDGSDEIDCSLVRVDHLSYVKDYVPPPTNGEDKLIIEMSIDIFRFLRLSETDFISSIQFQMHLRWRDSRLDFNHLRNDMDRNILTEEEKSTIWKPVVMFENTKDQYLSFTDEKTLIVVEKQSDYSISSSSQPWKSRQFWGSENDLHYFHTYSIDFQCDFELNNYPFDIQECYMIFSLPTRTEELLELRLSSLSHHGTNQLTQYTLTDYIIVNETTRSQNGRTDTAQVIKFVFKRRFTYQLFTVYIPTFCLMVIMQLTHYYPKKEFEATVMVGLTGMLVMTTLLLSVSNNLPPTNYIKLIDIWMLFGMVTPFVDIIIHTINFHHKEEEEANMDRLSSTTLPVDRSKQAWVSDQRKNIKRLQKKIRIGETMGKRVVPLLMMLFFVSYFIVCISVYKN